jgi:hypothetical protein
MRVPIQIAFRRSRPIAHAGFVSLVAAWMLAASAATPSALAQDAHSGVSVPDNSVLNAAPGEATHPAAKPSAAIQATQQPTVYGPYVPYHGPLASGSSAFASSAANSAAFDPDAIIVGEAAAGQDQRRRTISAKDANDPDAGIVTSVPSAPGEIADGTLIKARLREQLSTLTTRPGSKFTAEISEPVMREGRVVIPMGAIVEGRVTWVRGGKRIGGSAAIHIEPQRVTLPDGSEYLLRARVIDTNSWDNTKVDDEGTILRSENKKRNAAVMGLTTGGGIAAGAMIGGVPGALIGAGVGAGISTVVWLQQDRQAVLPKDLGLVFSLTEPMSTTPTSAEAVPPSPTTHGGA